MQKTENLIQKLAVLYLVVWTMSPPLGIDMIYRYLAIGCVVIWAIIAIKKGYYVEHIHIYAVCFVLFVIVIAFIEHDSLDGILQQIGIYILVVSFLMHAFYSNGRWDELRGIIPIILVLLIIFNYRTAEILIEDPSIARRIVRADESTFAYMRQGIGGYGLLYPQVCASPALFAWIVSAFKKNKLCFGIGCVWAYTFIKYLLSAGYSIAIFTTAVGLIMVFLYKGKNLIGAIALSAFIFLGVMAALLYSTEFREFALEMFEGTKVASKILDIVSSSETGVAEDSIAARMDAYVMSFNNMCQYPIIGSLWNANGGGHSAIMDNIAKYGLFGGIIYIKMIFCVPLQYKKKYLDVRIYSVSNAVILTTLFVGMLNSFSYNFMCMLLIIIPLLLEDIIRWEGLEE